MKNLRAKIGDNPRNPKWLHTVHGVGYRFEDPTDANDLPLNLQRVLPSGGARVFSGASTERSC